MEHKDDSDWRLYTTEGDSFRQTGSLEEDSSEMVLDSIREAGCTGLVINSEGKSRGQPANRSSPGMPAWKIVHHMATMHLNMLFVYFRNACILIFLRFYLKQDVHKSQKITRCSTKTPIGVIIRAEGIKDGIADMQLFQMLTRLNGTRQHSPPNQEYIWTVINELVNSETGNLTKLTCGYNVHFTVTTLEDFQSTTDNFYQQLNLKTATVFALPTSKWIFYLDY